MPLNPVGSAPERDNQKSNKSINQKPPTLMNRSTQDLENNLHVQPTVFFYNEDTFQEVYYRSVEDIRTIENNECLWIDVTGVSNKKSYYSLELT
jgi:hypothetical protein